MMKEATISASSSTARADRSVKDFGVRLRFFYGVDNPTSAASADFLPVSNDKGEFTIETPGPADYVVEATAPGYAPSYSANVNIAPGKSITSLVVKLGRGGSIPGPRRRRRRQAGCARARRDPGQQPIPTTRSRRPSGSNSRRTPRRSKCARTTRAGSRSRA
jgi:hypothetical protein